MAEVATDVKENGNGGSDEEEEYEWEFETESEDEVVDREVERRKSLEDQEEDDIPLEEQELPDPFSSAPLEATTKREEPSNGASNGEEKKKRREKNGEDGGERHRHHKKHKKSRHLERLEAFSKKDNGGGDDSKKKRIHVRSKDPSRIARQIEKSLNGSGGKQPKNTKGRPAPPPQKVTTECKICGKEPYVVERIVAEKAWWHKNCFRCKECNKALNLDTYMSHEGVIYCKPHHKELFQPKVVKSDLIDVNGTNKKKNKGSSFTEDAIARHKEQERKMETIVRESKPIDLGDEVVKASAVSEESKYQGLENLDVGSKFKMFEKGPSEDVRMPSSDRYGIMEKLKRLQEGEDLDELLAEIDEEIPSEEEEEDPEECGMTEVQKRTHKAEKLFGEGGQERRDKLAAERRQELKDLREKLMAGTKDSVMDQFGDLLNASANKVRKTKVDVRSENAKKFREMFDKGEVPEGVITLSSSDKITMEKDQELEMMRKTKRQQKEFFKKMEAGELDDAGGKKEPKLLVGKITKTSNGEINEDVPELASLSNRFSFFENFEEKESERKVKKKRKPVRLSPGPNEEGEESDAEGAVGPRHMTERDLARRDCKARSVLNKFKEMETKVLNGEDEEVKPDDPEKPVMTALGFLGRLPGVDNRRPLKRFTPPRKLGSESESDYSGSEYSDSSDYSDSDSYTSSYTSSDEEEDETLQAIRNTARAQKLRAKFEEWEQTQDAKEQIRQMMIQDENGESLETASNLKARFEALKIKEEVEAAEAGERAKFRPKRFK